MDKKNPLKFRFQRETAKHMITNDINFICSRLNKNGQKDICEIFVKVR